MIYDALEQLVLRKDAWALQRAFAPLDERARAKLSVPAQALYRQLSTGKAAPGASKRLKLLLWLRSQSARNPSNSAENCHARLALFAVGPLSSVKKRDVDITAEHMPVWDRIIRDRRPAWLDGWIAHQLDNEAHFPDFPRLRTWVKDGICAKPVADGYYRSFAASLLYPHRDSATGEVQTITAQLWADPALLSDIEGLFRVGNIAFHSRGWANSLAESGYETWPEALFKLSAEGQLDRAGLMQSALNGLHCDVGEDQLGGLCAFYRRMAPTGAELCRDQRGYVELLCHPASHVVKFAIDMLGISEKQDALDIEYALRELPIVFTRDGKGNALAALKLLKRIGGRDRHRSAALMAVGEALRHAHTDVQSAALDILDANSAHIAPEALSALHEMTAFAAASTRARLAQLLGTAAGSGSAAATGLLPNIAEALSYQPITGGQVVGPILRPEDAIIPIDTVDALIAAVLHAVEKVDSLDEVERIIDGMSRLGAIRPADFRAQVAPLLHRMRGRPEAESIVVGGAGVAGALRHLMLVWVKGLHRWRADIETTHGLPTTAFAPMTAHVRAIAWRVQRGESRILLSAPTHKGGWIDPLVWVERLRQLKAKSIVDSVDFRLSLLRLAPDGQGQARHHAAALETPLREIVEFTLGGDTRPTSADRRRYAAWITAARARDPHRDWREELALLKVGSRCPDGLRPARYSWSLSQTFDTKDQTPLWLLHIAATVDSDHSKAGAGWGDGSFVSRMIAGLTGRAAIDWRRLPTVAFNRRLEKRSDWFHGVSAAWTVQWLSFLWPQNQAAFHRHGAMKLTAWVNDNSPGWELGSGYLQPLFQRGRPWGELGHLLLCIGLNSRDADTRGLAVDAAIDGIDARLFDPAMFASILVRLAE
ncbi:DUF6493 family protein [Sphingomonas sp.]|uniref:DUF6493 family protein n=1 Tax=Sphingomonas sp. TaxID=28214 RepID=UPI003B3A230D